MIRNGLYISLFLITLAGSHGEARSQGSFAREPEPFQTGSFEQDAGAERRSPAPVPVSTRNGPALEARLRLVFTGDIMGHDTQIASALATGGPGYDYRPCFQYLAPYFRQADLVIGNLEVTLAGPPYKGYPQFSSPDELADALREAGFDILVMANNHALDRGQEGFERTIRQLDRRALVHTGTFATPRERSLSYPLVIQKNYIRIALLNYTYGTNGLRVPPPGIINRIDTVQIRGDLQKAAGAEPDFVLVVMHWGNEYERTENREQQELAQFLFRNGADAIIGSHPHVVQPIRGEGSGELVAYSMGNFISNQRDRYKDGGIAFQLDLVKTPEEHHIEGHAYLPFWVWKPATKKGTLFTLVPANADPSLFTDPPMTEEDRIQMKQFLQDTRDNLPGVDEVAPDWLHRDP